MSTRAVSGGSHILLEKPEVCGVCLHATHNQFIERIRNWEVQVERLWCAAPPKLAQAACFRFGEEQASTWPKQDHPGHHHAATSNLLEFSVVLTPIEALVRTRGLQDRVFREVQLHRDCGTLPH